MRGNIILFIVEGDSDERALLPWINQELLKIKARAKPKVMRGDILTEYSNKYSKEFMVSPSNVRGKIQELIKEYVSEQKNQSDAFRTNDIIKIYYVTDTDNCFMNKESHSENKNKCLSKMFNFEYIELTKTRKIGFEILFFSKDLEEIIHGNSVKTDEEKKKISNNFSEKSLKDRNYFINVFKTQSIKTWLSYKESYKGIRTYDGKACNMNVLIDEIEEGFKKLLKD